MHLKLSTITLASILSLAACGDDDPSGDGGGSDGSTVKDSGSGEDSGAEDSGTDSVGS